jgi:hypothetical protein
MSSVAKENDVADSVGGGIPCQKEWGREPRECDSRSKRRKPTRGARIGLRSDRTLTLAMAASEYIWLYDNRHGVSIEEIAAREGVSVGRVRYGVKRAGAQERDDSQDPLSEQSSLRPGSVLPPRLVPLFPIGLYTPLSACPHPEPIQQGSTLCCMVCHCSGMDAHPSLQRDPRTDPVPESKPQPAASILTQHNRSVPHETRKQRRQRKFVYQSPATQTS